MEKWGRRFGSGEPGSALGAWQERLCALCGPELCTCARSSLPQGWRAEEVNQGVEEAPEVPWGHHQEPIISGNRSSRWGFTKDSGWLSGVEWEPEDKVEAEG